MLYVVVNDNLSCLIRNLTKSANEQLLGTNPS